MPSVQRAARSVPARVPKMLRLLPCQRPASPELKLPPSATMAVVDDVGPALAAGATASTKAVSATTKAATFVPLIRPPYPIVGRSAPALREARTYPTAMTRFQLLVRTLREAVGSLFSDDSQGDGVSRTQLHRTAYRGGAGSLPPRGRRRARAAADGRSDRCHDGGAHIVPRGGDRPDPGDHRRVRCRAAGQLR